MVSLPDFDPNLRSFSGDDTTRNIMAQDVYELGSVFKIFTFALAIEDHTVRLDEVFSTGQGYKIGRYHHPRSRAHAGDPGRARYPGAILQYRHRPDRACARAARASASS